MKLLSIVTLTTFAVTSVQASIFDPAPAKITDGLSVVPQLNISAYHDDNIYTTESDPVSSMVYLVSPSFSFGTDNGVNNYGGEYQLISGSYAEDSNDNYVDHNLSFNAHTEFTDKHRLDIDFGFSNLHEDRGSNLTESEEYTYAEPLKYNLYETNIYYQYGSRSAIINIGGGILAEVQEYQNFTDQTQYDDTSTITVMLDGDYQIGNFTYLTTELSSADIAYSNQQAGVDKQDNKDNRVLIGVRWEGTGKTVASARAGYQDKNYEASSLDDFSGTTIDVSVLWQPLRRSQFELYISRAAEESNAYGDYIVAQSSAIAWLHNWTNKFDSDIRFSYVNDDYEGGDSDREDDIVNASLYLTYDFTRWFRVRTGYEYTDRDSNISRYSYDQNIVNLGVVLSL